MLDGERTLDEAIDDDARRNVAFAKRQRTWFRAERDVTWLDATDDVVSEAIGAVAPLLERRPGRASGA